MGNNSNNTITLGSESLKVEISKPGTLYKGSRFDWSGFITQVTLSDKYTFCVEEPLQNNKTTFGVGLCNEYMNFILTHDNERFPKLGIGILSKLEEGIVVENPFPIDVAYKSENSIRFTTKAIDCNGISAEIEKTITVSDQSLTIDYVAKNTGSKLIKTSEYNHNFIKINNYPIGSDYKLILPYKVSLLDKPEYIICNNNEITFAESPERSFYLLPKGYSKDKPHTWELHCLPAGVGVRETDSFPACKFALWGRNSVISPEIFADLDIKPGEESNWSRKYEFFELN